MSATLKSDEGITFYSNYGKDIDIAAPGGDTTDGKGNRNNPDGGVLQNTIAIGDPTKDDYFAATWARRWRRHTSRASRRSWSGEGVTDPTMVERSSRTARASPRTSSSPPRNTGLEFSMRPPRFARRAARPAAGSSASGLLIAGGAVAAGARRRGANLGLGYLGGVVAGASGLFFLPYTSRRRSPLRRSSTRWTHGLPS